MLSGWPPPSLFQVGVTVSLLKEHCLIVEGMKRKLLSQVWGCTPVIPVVGRERQEDQGQPRLHSKLDASLGYMRPSLKKKFLVYMTVSLLKYNLFICNSREKKGAGLAGETSPYLRATSLLQRTQIQFLVFTLACSQPLVTPAPTPFS